MDETPPLPPPAPAPVSEVTPANKDENTLGIVCHLLGFAGMAFPFGNIIGPLVLWLIKRAESPYLDACGKEVLNFQISWSIYGLAAALLCFVFIGILILPILGVAWLVFVILGSIKASEGKLYRYPLTIRLIS
jgi:uncharacterized Tic20 family protein